MHDQPLAHIDIVNSQSGMLAVLMEPEPANGSTNQRVSTYDVAIFGPAEGFRAYQQAVTEGDLYELLMAETGLSRKEIKVGLLRDVFGKRGRYPSDIERAFRRRFPRVWTFVRKFNRDDHAALLRELQRVESNLVIHGVGQRLQTLGIRGCVSLHDAVYCSRDDIGLVERAFREQLKALGFQLTLDVVV